MPTQLTEEITKGKDFDFRSYALRCASWIDYGSRVTDSCEKPLPNDEPLVAKPNNWYKEWCERLEKELETYLEWKHHNMGDAEKAYFEELHERIDANAESFKRNRERRQLRKRYEDMIAVVEKWHPDEKYESLKSLMIEQIKRCIEIDCYETDLPYQSKFPPIDEWLDSNIEIIEKDIVRYREKYAEECRLTEEANEWVRGLYKELDNFENENK